MDLPGNAGREPQTSFGLARAQCLPYGVLVISVKRGLIEQFDENSRLRPKDGIHAWGGYFCPSRDRFVRQALQHGHSITASFRSPERLKEFRDRITIKQGDLLNRTDLEGAIKGHDAVVSAFGPRVPVSKADAHLLEQFAAALTPAMQHAGVRRAVLESMAFLFRDSILPPVYVLGRLLFPRTVADASAMERIRLQSLARGRRRFHDPSCRESRIHRQSLWRMRLSRSVESISAPDS